MEGEALGRIAVAPERELTPGVIDSCFQLMGASLPVKPDDSDAYVPAGIARLVMARAEPVEPKLWCEATAFRHGGWGVPRGSEAFGSCWGVYRRDRRTSLTQGQRGSSDSGQRRGRLDLRDTLDRIASLWRNVRIHRYRGTSRGAAPRGSKARGSEPARCVRPAGRRP